MNNLDDLRSTLEQHAHDVRPLDHTTHQTQLKGRIMGIRRRRNAVRGGVALAAVATVAAGVLLPGYFSDAGKDLVAARTALGDVAPETKEALGFRYEFAELEENPTGNSVTMDLPAEPSIDTLRMPPLLTWTTSDSDAIVTVVADDGDEVLWSSRTGEFDDHVVLDTWDGGPVEVTSSEPGVAAALYAFDVDAPVPGHSAHAVTFKEPMQGSAIIASGIGAPGQARVEVPYAVNSPGVTLMAHCSGVDQPEEPDRGLAAAVRVNGKVVQAGQCSDQRGALHGGYFTFDLAPHQLEGTLSIELTRNANDNTPVADGPEELVMGVALYEPMEFVNFRGMLDSKIQEYAGHLWEVRTVERRGSAGDVSVDVPEGGMWLASAAWAAPLGEGLTNEQSVTLTADGEPLADPFGHVTHMLDRGVRTAPRLVTVGTRTLTASSKNIEDLRATQLLVWERVG